MIKGENLEISESGITLRKRGVVTDNFDFEHISYVEIKSGFRLKYWYLTLLLGLSVFFLTTRWLITFYENFTYNSDYYLGNVRTAWLMVFSVFFIAVLSVMVSKSSLDRTRILFLHQKSRSLRVNIGDLEKSGEINDLISFLKRKIETRIE